MPDLNVRNYVIGELRPLLPKKWLVHAFNALPDEVTTTSIVLTFQRYERNQSAPRGPRLATFTLTIVTPEMLPGSSDDAIDDDVIDLCNAIDAISGKTGLVWKTAERGTAKNRPGFDIEITVPVQLDPTPEETP